MRRAIDLEAASPCVADHERRPGLGDEFIAENQVR
ncbi:hypothetical protein SCE1572_12975 [Sorangium cellulosum So0157-2]|uniref:Uncharacterized protein n=1 Tax=Sorangium cellulosum So0157-2 TaxID=1254432 RepID=S4XXK9_SORCE|nr:hypothetical protein SCE1572_12975 [Sorangium cellulosum So0157-2]